MTFPKLPYEAVSDCNTDDGEECCWAVLVARAVAPTVNGFAYESHYVWIVKYGEHEYTIEDSDGNNLAKKKIYTTFNGAKKKADEIGFWQCNKKTFTD